MSNFNERKGSVQWFAKSKRQIKTLPTTLQKKDMRYNIMMLQPNKYDDRTF